uniref:Fibrosin n=1 Tax=Tetraodon nigroviridis TaxID=99883 RepID=H3CXJ8_TETNG
MEGPSRSTGFRQSRRSRSQRDRERRRRRVNLAQDRATSMSSGSDREACGTNSVLGPGNRECRPGFGRHRPPRRRKRESVSCEEDVIDGFAIASFISLEALEKKCCLKPEDGISNVYCMLIKVERDNFLNSLFFPSHTSYLRMDCSLKPSQRTDLLGRRNKGKRGPEENGGGPLSEPEEGAAHSYSSSCWKNNRKKRRRLEGHPLETGYICDTESDTGDKASDNEIDPVFTVSTRKGMGTSVGKSCPNLPARSGGVSRLLVTPRVSGLERSQEKSLEQHFPEPVCSSTSSAPFSRLPSPITASATVSRPSPFNGNGSPPLSKPKPFLTLPGRSHSIYHNNRYYIPPLWFSDPVFTSLTVFFFVFVFRSSTPVKPPSASAVGSSSSSMRPPTPSARGSASSGPLRPPSRASSGTLFTSSPGLPPPPPLLQGPAHSAAAGTFHRKALPDSNMFLNSASGSSGRASQNQPSIPPLAFQFHQHNHQHQHTHTHQHFTPFLHPTATAPPLFDKYPGKMDGLYRHSFFPQYPPPSVPNIQPVIPPTGPFSSLQGAFQPKLPDPFGTSLKKPGKWCAMHVYLAWMILSHQKKVKQLMQAEPHKLDFRSDPLARLPGTGGLGPLGTIGGGLPPTHELTRPPSLFPAAGPVNPSSAQFISPPTAHSSFLPPPAHLDPYGRSPPFTPLGALGSGAFGGLGSPTIVRTTAGSVFGHKDSPATVVGGLPNANHHDPWNRLHGGPAAFPAGPSWAKGADKRDERDRGKDGERRDIPHIKDEKDSLNRDRERDGEKRPLPSMSSRGLPLGSSSLGADRDRPRSSSSALTTPPPSNRSAASPLDLYPRSLASTAHGLHGDHSHSHRDGGIPSSAATASVASLSQAKKSDRTTTPVSKPSLPLPPVKVKEERKEESEHIPITLPPSATNHSFDRPRSHPHQPSSGTPSSSSLSLTPTPGVPLLPHTPGHPPTHLQLLDRSRAIEAYLGSAVVGPGERFPHGPFTWDPWRELAQQQHHRREVLSLRPDPHLALRPDPHVARLLEHQRFLEAERAAAVAAATELGLMAHHFDRPPHLGPPGGGLIDEEQRAQILREDFERARYFGMHPHLPPGSHLSSPSHAATATHLEQLHPGLLSHSLPPGASPASQHHAGLYARLGPLNPHHMPNGILSKSPAGLVGALAVGAPPPLIPSLASRSSTPPRGSRLSGPGELALYSAHKDGESR